MKKIVSVFLIVCFLGVSTAYAHDSDDDYRNDQAAGIAIIAALAFTTVAFLLMTHDGHGGPPARHPGHPPNPGHSRHFSQDGSTDTYVTMSNEEIHSLQVSKVQ